MKIGADTSVSYGKGWLPGATGHIRARQENGDLCLYEKRRGYAIWFSPFLSLSFDPIGNNSTPHVFVSLSSVTVPNTNCALRGYVYITATVRTGQAADIGVGLKRGGNKKKKMYLFQKANGLTVGCVMRRKRRGEDSATSLYGDGRECRPSSPQISTPSFSVCLPRGPSLSTRADDSGQLFLF